MLEENVKILLLDFAHIYLLFSLTPVRKKILKNKEVLNKLCFWKWKILCEKEVSY